MKYLLTVLMLSLPLATAAAERTVRLSVPGMSCATCPVTMKKSLELVPGVSVRSVDLKSKTAVVVTDGGVADTDLMRATTDAGYPSTVIPENTP